MTKKAINKIFIANRGEICRRVATGARKLGISSATIVEESNPPQYLLDAVDDCFFVRGITTNLYLQIDKMIAFAKQLGCDAIHPGYGYLSENANFVRAVTEAGLTWVGPHADAMVQMASKAEARKIAEKHKVPCLEAMNISENESLDKIKKDVETFADRLGYPVLVKATMGGGGKGMRIVHESSAILTEIERARSEAINSFADGSLIIEKYIEVPRHIEVQIAADKHGNAYAIGDRDCSVQRRHQKIIEEAPAPFINEETRRELHESACRLATAVGYDSVGTVEYLLDWSEGPIESGVQPFYFLEMNTRLQVEHPVTEESYGVDLVNIQIRAARGEELPQTLKNLPFRGHSVELRIYAEDCENNFMPSPGNVDLYIPAYGAGVRWDSGIDTVDKISPEFDPMISKLIVHAETREDALQKCVDVLERSVLSGLTTNVGYLIQICQDEEFQSCAVGTDYLKRRGPDLVEKLQNRKSEVARRGEALMKSFDSYFGGFSNSPNSLSDSDVVTQRTNSVFQASSVTTQATNDDIMMSSLHSMTLFGKSVDWRTCQKASDGRNDSFVLYRRRHKDFVSFGFSCSGIDQNVRSEPHTLDTYAHGDASGQKTKSPVPGKVIAINYGAGDKVPKNEVVVILESMKMQFEVKADEERVVSEVLVAQGEQVDAGTVLLSWQES